jgi:hypothetical protein
LVDSNGKFNNPYNEMVDETSMSGSSSVRETEEEGHDMKNGGNS